MAKVIFRKIKGRLVPIKIKSWKGDGADKYVNKRTIAAIADDARETVLGYANISIPKKGRHATVDAIKVYPGFRRRGIAKNLMKHIANLTNRANKPFLRTGGHGLQSPAMVNIRRRLGKSKFWADGFGPYGEQTKLVKPMKAKNIIRNDSTKVVDTTTLLKKKKWKIK